MSLTSAHILKALESVVLPEGGVSLTASGRLSPVVVDDARVMLSISISAAEAAPMETVRQHAETVIRALAGSRKVLVSLTSDHVQKPAQTDGLAQVRHVIAIASGKGGVGKSTTAANLALALHRLGLRVGLLDADIYGPSIPKLFGLAEKPASEDGKIIPLTRHGLKIMSIGLMINETTPMIWRGPMVATALKQMLKDVAWGALDVLVVDMPPGTGDVQLSLAQTASLSGAVIVSTPQDLALMDARRGIMMFRKVNVPVLGVIENMSYFCCPDCGHVSHIFGHGGARQAAESMDVPFLGEVPLHLSIRETSDLGLPIVSSDPSGEFSGLYTTIASEVWKRMSA